MVENCTKKDSNQATGSSITGDALIRFQVTGTCVLCGGELEKDHTVTAWIDGIVRRYLWCVNCSVAFTHEVNLRLAWDLSHTPRASHRASHWASRFRTALDYAVAELLTRSEKDRQEIIESAGYTDLESFKQGMRDEFARSPNLPIDVGNEVIQYLESLDESTDRESDWR